jgi:leucyl aminopeptidase (aminopeptidase T)
MATKPLLPEVIAERAKAADDYRKAHQAAIDRIEKLRAARMQRDAETEAARADPEPTPKAASKRVSASSQKHEKVRSDRANAVTGA